MLAKRIHIKGLVQGVGFRPFIYRLAHDNRINGWVENNNEGVTIYAQGEAGDISTLCDDILNKKPIASEISSMDIYDEEIKGFKNFTIRKSSDHSDAITDVSPDIAVCDACLQDMKNQAHRIDYPFVNCTNCGPRFTIIRELPYDRPKTTMAPFKMCEQCEHEYSDILDRRFHAQPVACNNCGPEYRLFSGEKSAEDLHEIFKIISDLLDKGKIIAMKGLGGYHLACNAANQGSVNRLREAKLRDGKPFAVMFRDIATAKKFAFISDEEQKQLLSWQRPILLLESKKKLAQGVSMDFGTIGGMLPYLPFHHLLFEYIKQDVIVLTSGNISDEPIIIDDDAAKEILGTIADAVLVSNREIYNRTDDSVMRVINNKPRLIRRSRSWVPRPVNLKINVDGIVACGAELVNCFCIGKGKQAILSQHIGDLKNAETLDFFTESIHRFYRLFRVKPSTLVHDLHPDYLSTRYALDQETECIAVQHHHAHIAACMAEHGLDEPVIGISFDGVGMGTDGHIWGGEFIVCDLAGFERKLYFDYVPMPGGDMATREPWRMALSYLIKAYGEIPDIKIPFLKEIPHEKIKGVQQAIKMGINTPHTSSTGRLFDAVAAITGLCHTASFHAEAPMRLEGAIDSSETGTYNFAIGKTIDTTQIIREICNDMTDKIPIPVIAARFHNSVINIIFAAAKLISKESGIKKIALSGGSFQNKYLLEKAEKGLAKMGFEVFTPQEIPANDGGIALGQLAIAAKIKNEKKEYRTS